MKIKSLRENYSKLLQTFKDAGIKFNESQKAALDSFCLVLEAKIDKTKKMAVKKTKKIVTENLEAQYKKMFMKIMENIEKNQALASKIQKKSVKLNEHKKIASKVNDYLKLYVESVLPRKEIVNYTKFKKMTKLIESLKDELLINDESVEAKKKELTESFNAQKREMETKLAKMQVKLNESMKKTMAVAKENSRLEAVKLLESKTRDLPIYEAAQIKKRFAKASVEEIKKNYQRVLESIQKISEDDESGEETTLEAEINQILGDNDSCSNGECNEDDPRDRQGKEAKNYHNTHEISEDDEEDVKEAEEDIEEAEAEDIEEGEEEDIEEGEDEDIEESDAEADELEESVGSARMARWIEMCKF